jgi:hypothetical protein
VIDSAPVFAKVLVWFPTEALHFIPAFQSLASAATAELKAANFRELSEKMIGHANPEEESALRGLVSEIYGE